MVKLAPLVTGISPKEGPPGTRVTLRGENLGNDSRDLTGLTICGVDCLLSAVWKSPKQIIVRTGQAKGKGDIVVTTRSGGQGTSTVQFRGFQIQIGPLQESAIWVDETQLYSAMENRGKSNPVDLEYLDDPLGICDESNDKKPTEEELQDLLQEGSDKTDGSFISSSQKSNACLLAYSSSFFVPLLVVMATICLPKDPLFRL